MKNRFERIGLSRPASHQLHNSLLGRLRPLDEPHHSARAHHQHPGAQVEHLRQFRGDHENRVARRGQFVNEPMDFGFRAHVHSAVIAKPRVVFRTRAH